MRQEYLHCLHARLWLLPASKRGEIHQELATHIDLLVLEERHRNSSPLDAARNALDQFGDPALLGRLLAWQWHKENLLMNKKNIAVASLLLFLALAPLAIALQKPPMVARQIEVGPLSLAERRSFKGLNTKVVVEVKESPSFVQRPFAQNWLTGGGPDDTYLVDATGRKYSWTNDVTVFARRGKNLLVTYPIPLSKVPRSAGKVTFVAQIAKGKEWRALPISVVVRP
jgi:hypothetical protein